MLDQPRVTIAIPVYNGSNYLAEAIDSALGQTYRNTEVIVVNDGSTDGGATDAIARRYGDRITYITQENKGVGGAMNTVVARMTGDVFTWLSHDDLHLPDKASSQVVFQKKLGKKDAILFSDFYLIDEQGKVWHETKLPFELFMKTPMWPLHMGAINGCTLFIPAWIMRDFGPFDETLRYTQDYDLWNRILSKHEFFLQRKPLVKYRVHPGQGTQNPEAAVEGDALWIRILESRTDMERVQLFGSNKKFFASMTEFLDRTPYKKAAAYARSRTMSVTSATVVSVIIPFFNKVHKVLRAAHSVLGQTHEKIELILIDDGSTEDMTAVHALTVNDRRVRVLRQRHAGMGAARNRGIAEASGDYIAFSDADVLFLPNKLELQLSVMQESGIVMSHTSYHIYFPERYQNLGKLNSGTVSGNVCPGECPIATSTVMLHRSIINSGFIFPDAGFVGDDLLSWIWIAQRCRLSGIDELLSIHEWSNTSSAINLDESIRRLTYVISQLENDPSPHQCEKQICNLRETLNRYAAVHERMTGNGGHSPLLNEDLISHAFSGQRTIEHWGRVSGEREAFADLERAILDKDARLRERDIAVTERDEARTQLARVEAERDARLRERDTALAELNEARAQLARVEAEKESQLRELDEARMQLARGAIARIRDHKNRDGHEPTLKLQR